MLLAVLLAGAAGLVTVVRGAPTDRVAGRLAPGAVTGAGRPAAAPGERGAAGRRLSPGRACLLAAGAVLVLVPSPTGLGVAAAVVALGPVALGRLEPRAARIDREQLSRDLPVAMDLLAACLAGGAHPAHAAAAVGAAVGGACGDRFTAVAGALRAGSPPELAWAVLAAPPGPAGPGPAGSGPAGSPDDPLAPVARLLVRAATGGAPVAVPVGRLAADVRATGSAQAQQAARRVGVLVVAPLGLCFLPAFVLLGVVPVVLGLAAPMLSP